MGEGYHRARPLLLLERPEAAEVLAVVPDGPPRHFPLARRAASGGRGAGPGAHHAGVVAPHGRADARLLRRGGRGRAPLLALPRRPLRHEAAATPQWFVHGVFG